MPEARAPDASASSTPGPSQRIWAAITMLTPSASGVARRKLPAVTAVGSPPAVRPRSVYTAQATPAPAISRPADKDGVASPGSSSHTSPALAAARPSHCSGSSRSPRHRPQPIIVVCTTPNSSSAPVAALRLT